jgi:hypothetical protein
MHGVQSQWGLLHSFETLLFVSLITSQISLESQRRRHRSPSQAPSLIMTKSTNSAKTKMSACLLLTSCPSSESSVPSLCFVYKFPLPRSALVIHLSQGLDCASHSAFSALASARPPCGEGWPTLQQDVCSCQDPSFQSSNLYN